MRERVSRRLHCALLAEMSLSKETKHLHMTEQKTVFLLMGKTGTGKSASGNIIFNDQVFDSEMRSSSVTRVCQTHTGCVNNRTVTVIDTPDFRFSTHTDFEANFELMKALELCSPGAHVILLILPLNTFTEQEKDFIDWFQQTFGVEALRFTLVLFTHADKTHRRPLGEMIRKNTKLSDFINRCGERYHDFNMKNQSNRHQVNELMEKIDRLLSENRNSCYTFDMMQETERRRKENERREEEEKKAEEERKEREHRMTLERVRIETETRVRREYEQEILEKQKTVWKKLKHLFVKQIKLKYFYAVIFFAVATGGVSVWKEVSSHGWMFAKGFFTGGSAAAAGVLTGILWRLMWKSQFICSSSHERPSAVRQLLLKAAGVVCGLSAGAVIGQFVGGNVFPVTALAGLAGAAGVFTVIQ